MCISTGLVAYARVERPIVGLIESRERLCCLQGIVCGEGRGTNEGKVAFQGSCRDRTPTGIEGMKLEQSPLVFR